MSSQTKSSSLQQLSSLCDDRLSLRAKIGLVTLSKTYYSHLFEKLLLSLEYLQLFNPLLISTLSFQSPKESWLPKLLLLIAKLLNPGYWISFDDMDNLSITTLALVFAFIASKLVVFAFIAYKLARNCEVSPDLIKVWKIIFKLQTRITYFYITSFLVNALTVPNSQEGQTKGNRSTAFTIVSFIALTLEFFFSLLLNLCYKYNLPTKSFLSAKDNKLEVITLLQKLILQIFMASLASDSRATVWVFATFNVLVDRLRLAYYFNQLPLYNFQALLWQWHLLLLVSSFNLSCFVLCIVKEVDENSSSLVYLLIIWLILFLLGLKIIREYWYKAFWRVVADPTVTSPDLLIHRISAIKQLAYFGEKVTEWNKDYEWTLLLNETLNRNLSNIMKIDVTKGSLNTRSKASAMILFKNYLEKLLELYPKNPLIKLYAAKFLAKKFNIYGENVRMLKPLIKGPSRSTSVHAELILMEIQNQIKKYSQEKFKENQFDPFIYIEEHSQLAQLKVNMIKQANLQIKIYTELKKDSPDLSMILNSSQILKTWRDKITAQITSLTKKTSESHLEPFLLSAQYHLILNHSISEHLNFAKVYTQRYQKHFKSFEEENLSHRNMFQSNTGFLILSGQKTDAGAIIFTSKNQLPSARGVQAVHLNERAAPCIRAFYNAFYKGLADDNTNPFFNKVMRGYSYSEDGCLLECDFVVNIHPHVTQDFYFVLLYRPVNSNRDAFYVTENGDLDGATKNLRELLGFPDIRQGPVNVRDFSEELAMVNHACNMSLFPERFSNEIDGKVLTKEKADEICYLYTTEGKNVFLRPVNQPNNAYLYHCKVENTVLGTAVVKIMILEQASREKKPLPMVSTKPKSFLPAARETNAFTQDYENDDFFSIGDEKDQGWIDFDLMTSPQNALTPKRDFVWTETLKDQECTTNRTLLESRRLRNKNIIEGGQQASRPGSSRTDRRFESIPATNSAKLETKDENEPADHRPTNPTSLTGSRSSNLSHRKKLSNIFKKSLETPYISKLAKVLLLVFYLALAILIGSQIALSMSTKASSSELEIKKDFLRNFQSRNYLTSSIAGIVRTVIAYDTHELDFSKSLIVSMAPMQYVKYSLLTLFTGLSDLNKYLVLNAKDIDQDTRSLLFKENIPIYDTYFTDAVQTYQNLSTIQATDKVIETGLAFLDAGNSTEPQANQQALFLLRNGLNDLVIRNQKIADVLNDLFISQRKTIENIIWIYLRFLLAIFGAILIVFAFIIQKQYIKEKKNLLALSQLSNKQIDYILKECLKFKEDIEDQKSLIERALNLKTGEDKRGGFERKRVNQAPSLKGIKRKYYVYLGKFLIVIALLTGLVVVSSSISKNVIDNFKDEQDQIKFIDRLKTISTLSMQTYSELISTNNVAMVENRSALKELQYLLTEIQTARSDIYGTLLTTEVIKDGPITETYLLGEACEILDSPYYYLSCLILKTSGKKTGLVYLLSELEDILTGKVQDFEASDKSKASLVEIKMDDYDLMSSIFTILVGGLDNLANLINDRLNVEIDRSHRVIIFILVFFCAFGVVVGLLGWIFLLKEIKEGVGRFKNVLRLFPAEVIFSSFLLKTFLLKTSRNTIGYVKN